jgi:UDP-glucose:(heptosyl)LPS alpha-1,3-glucosyltransferase
MARQLRIERQVRFMGLRNDVPRMLLCADVLLHPAYRENTGTVLLEAIVAGLPVLASDVCGYAFHIGESRAGLLVPSPFSQVEMNQRLRFMLTSGRLGEWRDRALEYMRRTDLFSLKERAVDLIEEIVARPVRPCGVGSRVE